MTIKRRRFIKGIKLDPDTTSLTEEGEVKYDNSAKKVQYQDDVGTKSVVSEEGTQTLTNKTMDFTSSTGTNTISADAVDIEYDNATSGLTATNLQSAIDELDVRLENQDQASEISYDNSTSGLTATNVQAAVDEVEARVESIEGDLPAGDLVGTTDVQTLTNKTIDADNNTITNIKDDEIAADADITRTKLAPGTADHVVINDGFGEISSEVALAKVRGGTGADNTAVTFPTTGVITTEDSTSTLTNKTIDGDDNTIQDLALSSLKTDGTNLNKLIGRDGTGEVVNLKDSPVGEVVGTTDTQDLSGKTFTDSITVQEQAITPTTPAVGDKKLYAKTDGQFYTLDSAGNEVPLGSGTGGGSLNFYEFPDAEPPASTADFTTGNNATFTGGGTLQGALTISSTPADVIRGSNSYKLVLNATPGSSDGDYVATDPIDIPQGYRGRNLAVKFQYKYDGNSGDIVARVYDTTNSVLLTSDALTLSKEDTVGNTAREFGLTFYCPADCAQVEFGFQVLTHSVGSEELIWDDVVVTPDVISVADLSSDSIFGAKISNNGVSAAIVSQGPKEWIASVSRTGLGQVTVTFVTGFFKQAPVLVATSGDNLTSVVLFNDSVSAVVSVESTTASSGDDSQFEIMAVRQGQDTGYSTNILVQNDSVQPIKYTSSLFPVIAKSSPVILNFDSQVFDDNSLVTTGASWKWRAPKFGKIKLAGLVILRMAAPGTINANQTGHLQVFINGSAVETIGDQEIYATSPSGAYNVEFPYGTLLEVQEGDELDLRMTHNFSDQDMTLFNPGSFICINYEDVKPISALALPQVAYVKDIKAGPQNGGSVIGGGTWQTRDLNILQGDSSFISVSSNQITLKPGTYTIDASAPAFLVANHVLRFRDITNGITAIPGENARANADCNTRATLSGFLTIVSPTVYELQHAGTLPKATNGFGVEDSISLDSTFSVVKIQKIR